MGSVRATNGRYGRQNAPFIITAVNLEIGWTKDVPDLPGR